MPKFRFFRRLSPAERSPPFYGRVTTDFLTNTTIVAPIPLNMIACVALNVFAMLRHCTVRMPVTPHLAYWQGRRDQREGRTDERS